MLDPAEDADLFLEELILESGRAGPRSGVFDARWPESTKTRATLRLHRTAAGRDTSEGNATARRKTAAEEERQERARTSFCVFFPAASRRPKTVSRNGRATVWQKS